MLLDRGTVAGYSGGGCGVVFRYTPEEVRALHHGTGQRRKAGYYIYEVRDGGVELCDSDRGGFGPALAHRVKELLGIVGELYRPEVGLAMLKNVILTGKLPPRAQWRRVLGKFHRVPRPAGTRTGSTMTRSRTRRRSSWS